MEDGDEDEAEEKSKSTHSKGRKSQNGKDSVKNGVGASKGS